MWWTTPFSMCRMTGSWQGKEAEGNHMRSFAHLRRRCRGACSPRGRRCGSGGAWRASCPSSARRPPAPPPGTSPACRRSRGSSPRWRWAAPPAAPWRRTRPRPGRAPASCRSPPLGPFAPARSSSIPSSPFNNPSIHHRDTEAQRRKL